MPFKPTCFASLLALVVSAAPALAASARTFVSGHGTDAGSCSSTAPCRSFAFALTQTTPAGEIVVLDSAGYGPVTIQQAVSIVSPDGIEGEITAASGANAITISANASDNVVLRGLTIEGANMGNEGILFTSGGSLAVVDCIVRDFTDNGILFQPTAGALNIVISNTTASNNDGTGIVYSPQSGNATASIFIDHVNATNNIDGISINTQVANSGIVNTTISNSVASNNSNAGAFINTRGGGTTTIDLSYFNNNLARSGAGIIDQTTILLSRSVITSNYAGLANQPGVAYTYGDNRINGNTQYDVENTLTTYTPQ